ncbi:DNA topoisomerase IB [Labrys sp. KNU-23]|uniref:DNA topoisomerase IB n=1 Tax=Labrys sp. KNU-23 TaxID=2789216 RepID=UPI0011EE7CAE|nr:DNA topoisomerase IB [Labrys sp. KNU-23]QEN85280.1 DNA topoisomerase IB [Labrys sp. KNU-23]
MPRLRIVSPDQLDLRRRRCGRGFSYLDAAGHRITDKTALARFRALAIPPAYSQVRIAADEQAHIQAIGRDEAGRLQYRYHSEWERRRENRKALNMVRLVRTLPRIRAAIRRDLASPKLDRNKAIACAIALIDSTHIRVGGAAYARDNGSHGAATLLKRHVTIKAGRVELRFRGKGGKPIHCMTEDAALARALGRLRTLSGPRLFQFVNADGSRRLIEAGDINAYLRDISGIDVTAKDLRLLGASKWAVQELAALTPARSVAGRKRQIAAVMRQVSYHLVNTPAVARKSYVPALIVESFKTGRLQAAFMKARSRGYRRRAEAALHLLATKERSV